MHSKTFFCNGWQLGKQTELGWFTVDEFAINHLNTSYRKVASSRLSWLVAHFHIFRLFMKGKFDAYVPLAKRVQN